MPVNRGFPGVARHLPRAGCGGCRDGGREVRAPVRAPDASRWPGGAVWTRSSRLCGGQELRGESRGLPLPWLQRRCGQQGGERRAGLDGRAAAASASLGGCNSCAALAAGGEHREVGARPIDGGGAQGAPPPGRGPPAKRGDAAVGEGQCRPRGWHPARCARHAVAAAAHQGRDLHPHATDNVAPAAPKGPAPREQAPKRRVGGAEGRHAGQRKEAEAP